MAEGAMSDRLAWLDLEMTGLDVQRDVILQAALIVTDGELRQLASIVVDIWQPEHHLAAMSPFVRDMHDKTGLLARVATSKVDLRDAERRLLELLCHHCSYPATLCGNSVGMDKRFIERYMPTLAGYFHYRILDVSSFKIVAQRYFGPDAQFQKSSAGEHDALVDIQNSIAEFAHYRAKLLRPPTK